MRSLALAAVVAACISCEAPSIASAQTTVSIGSIAVPHTATAPPIDAALDDPAWKNAVVAQLSYDLRNHQSADQATTVYLMSDGAFLYVGVDARQTIPVRATEHTNGVGLDTDDEFQIDLWPNGTSGYMYKFTSTPIGTHYQYSTENNAFEPEWWSAGKIVPGGYVITMKIPLNVMHGTGTGDWRTQFIRYMPVTNDAFVWSYGEAQQGFNDVNYSGSLSGLPRLAELRAKPRIGIYGLGEIASQQVGGSTSRAGADLSIPLVPGATLVGTIHPDYSNVEIDQQTIAPTAFQRFFQEVRPFFTQGGNFYSYPNGVCINCGISEYYTPKIPTPRDGFAIEGQRGLFSYGTLESLSLNRTDTAAALNWVSRNQKTALDYQGTFVNATGAQALGLSGQTNARDDTDGVAFSQSNLTNLTEYLRYSDDSGTNVVDGSHAQRYEGGFQYFQPDGTNVGVAMRKVGEFYNPYDAIVQHSDIAGYVVNFFKPFKYATTARFTQFQINGNLDRFHDHTGALDQTDNGLFGAVTTRTLWNFQASTGSSYVLLGSAFTPINQQGEQIGYNLNSLFPSFVAYNTGNFGTGRLHSWFRSASIRAGTRGAITFDDNETDQLVTAGLDTGMRFTQWLERVGFSYQSGPNQSLALGVRRIIGTPPELFAPAANCTTVPGDCGFSSGWNLSAAFHQKVPQGEFYVVYGDAAAFSTAPQFIIKYIRYIGADKGT